MGKNEEPQDQQKPEDAVARRKLFWEKFWANMSPRASLDAREKLFARTRLGKWWIPIRTELQKTKSGRMKLLAVQIGRIVLAFALLLGVSPVVNWVFDTWVHPADYKLTASEVQQGYDQTQSSGRSASNEGVAWRGFTEAEYKSIPGCRQSYNFCVMAIPLYKDCQEIYMEFSTAEKSDAFSATVENLTAVARPRLGTSFNPGEHVVLGVAAKNPKSNYGGADHIYCRSVN